MFECRWTYDVERWLDGEHAAPQSVEAHIAACPACAAHAARLQGMRDGVRLVVRQQEIADPQFGSFFEGIRERLEPPRRSHRGIWALVSLTAAALIVAVATLIVFNNGPQKAEATVVESVSSGIDGAKVGSYDSSNGVTTVWLKVPAGKDDIL